MTTNSTKPAKKAKTSVKRKLVDWSAPTPTSQFRQRHKPKYTRGDAIADTIKRLPKRGAAKYDFIKATNDLYTKKGGKSNISAAYFLFNASCPLLRRLKIIRFEEDQIFRI